MIIPRTLGQLGALTRGNARQNERLTRPEHLVSEELPALKRTIEIGEKQGLSAGVALIHAREKEAMVGVVLVFRDITARKKAEEESLRLTSIVEFSGDAIVSQRLDGVMLSWNAAAARMFGYLEAEMVGSKLSLLALEVLWAIRSGFWSASAPVSRPSIMKRSGIARTAP